MPSIHPSGAQFELSHDDQRAVVVEVGGALRLYEVRGTAVLDGYGVDQMCSAARGQTLVPWPNRLCDGTYRFAGEDHQVPLSEPERHNAIHGLARWANWSAVEHRRDRVVMGHRLHPQAGYPFALDLSLEYRLDASGLTVTLAARNVGRRACPFGAGAHPYVTVGTPTIDDVSLRAPGRRRLISDDRGIPVASEPVDGTPYDLRAPGRLGDLQLDTAFGRLDRDPDGRGTVTVVDPGGDRRVTVWMDERYDYVMLFTGDSLPEPDRRRRSLGVEPMSCAPNAFQTGEGLTVLEPDESWAASWGISPTR